MYEGEVTELTPEFTESEVSAEGGSVEPEHVKAAGEGEGCRPQATRGHTSFRLSVAAVQALRPDACQSFIQAVAACCAVCVCQVLEDTLCLCGLPAGHGGAASLALYFLAAPAAPLFVQAAGYGKVVSHVIIGLKTVKGTKQLKLDPTIYDSLQKERVQVRNAKLLPQAPPAQAHPESNKQHPECGPHSSVGAAAVCAAANLGHAHELQHALHQLHQASA